jgi:hypothetical protein
MVTNRAQNQQLHNWRTNEYARFQHRRLLKGAYVCENVHHEGYEIYKEKIFVDIVEILLSVMKYRVQHFQICHRNRPRIGNRCASLLVPRHVRRDLVIYMPEAFQQQMQHEKNLQSAEYLHDRCEKVQEYEEWIDVPWCLVQYYAHEQHNDRHQ